MKTVYVQEISRTEYKIIIAVEPGTSGKPGETLIIYNESRRLNSFIH